MLDLEGKLGLGVNTLQGLIYHGVVADIPAANQFVCPTLALLGAGKFANSYYVVVFRDVGGAGAAPQGESRKITAYTTGTGLFAHDAFSAALADGDEVLIVSPLVYDAASTFAPEPTEDLIETWSDLAIDPNIWTETDPATGGAWNPSIVGPYIYCLTSPNAGETARLVGDYLWQLHSATPNLNQIVKKTVLEFSLVVGTVANVDNALTFFGWVPDVGNTRADDNIIGFGFVGDALQTITDLGSTETVNTGFGETIGNHNKFKIEVYEGYADFYLNEVRIARHTTNIPNVPCYPNWFIDTEGGACALSLGIVKIWYEMAERY